tara:strand:- start:22 stop:156 length:135 start_codon:yes stop_codon:yes gene_type:complete
MTEKSLIKEINTLFFSFTFFFRVVRYLTLIKVSGKTKLEVKTNE